jgi:hypothetical protein
LFLFKKSLEIIAQKKNKVKANMYCGFTRFIFAGKRVLRCLNEKLALRPCPTPVRIQELSSRDGLLLAFGAIGLGRLPKGLFTVVAESSTAI